MDFEVIETWRVEAMFEYIKNHFQSKNLLIPSGDSLQEVCDNYLFFIKNNSFTICGDGKELVVNE